MSLNLLCVSVCVCVWKGAELSFRFKLYFLCVSLFSSAFLCVRLSFSEFFCVSLFCTACHCNSPYFTENRCIAIFFDLFRAVKIKAQELKGKGQGSMKKEYIETIREEK